MKAKDEILLNVSLIAQTMKHNSTVNFECETSFVCRFNTADSQETVRENAGCFQAYKIFIVIFAKLVDFDV